jgi:hypothetical protein
MPVQQEQVRLLLPPAAAAYCQPLAQLLLPVLLPLL